MEKSWLLMIKINSQSAEEIVRIIRRKKRQKRFGADFYECVICLDLETTSFLYHKTEKAGYCYIWTLSVDGRVYYGRRLKQLASTLKYISLKLHLDDKHRIMVFVHNLGFDFQFFRKYFNVISLLAREGRDVLYATTCNGIEFRCSYALTGYSLDYWGEELGFRKLKGYNYELVRHSQTPLSDFEMSYAERDVLVMHKGLSEKAEREGGITKFELTKTGYVRKYLREMTIENDEYKNDYKALMKKLQITAKEYERLKKTFMGGFTHASAYHSNITLSAMESWDLISAYPGVMVSEKFPMEKIELDIKNDDEFYMALDRYACDMVIEVEGVTKIFQADSYISFHKLDEIANEKHAKRDNGRVVNVEKAIMYITDVDYRIIRKAYKIDRIRIIDYQFYRYDYLPKPFILAVLKLYNDKTILKGNEEKIVEYILAKNNINACYGGMVTDIVPDECPYIDNEWQDKRKGDVDTYIEKYNKSLKRTLSYAWGVWVTAHCRARLWQLIFARDKQYVYSDTDSGKLRYAESNLKVINTINTLQKQKLLNMCEYYNIDYELCQPRGYVIGTYMIETVITRFKTLGSKRYLTEGYKVKCENGQMKVSDKLFIKLTFSGVNDKIALRYLKRQAIKQIIKSGKSPLKGRKLNVELRNGIIFENFKLGMFFPAHAVGKMEHAYNDNMVKTKLIDYLGNEYEIESPSSVYLNKVDYQVKCDEDYIDYGEDLRAILGIYQEMG